MPITQIVQENVSDYVRTRFREVENPHDKFFKETFSHIEVAKSFLHHYLPLNVIEVLDMGTLELQKDSFINKELEEGFSDLLFSANINGREGYVYFLFEHKSYPDKAVVFQLLKYMAEIWNTKIKKEKADQLPVILPLVVYHGTSRWNIETVLGEMIAGYKNLSPEIRKFIPGYQYLVYDISKYTDREIKGEARVKILFTMFRDVQKTENVQELLLIIDKAVAYLQELDDKQTGMEYFETFIRYIFSAAKNLTREDAVEVIRKVENTYSEGREFVMTLADILREEGKEEGKEEGIRKGKEAVVKNAVKEGMKIHLIEKLTGLPRKEIEKITAELNE